MITLKRTMISEPSVLVMLVRFLHEDPWKRLDLLRQKIPNIPFQVRTNSPFFPSQTLQQPR